MRSIARHLGLAVLILGACAVMGAAPKTEPAKTAARAKPARATVTVAKPTKSATTAKAKTVAAPAAAMRVEREPGAVHGLAKAGIIPYVEPVAEQIGQPIETRHADGSVEVFLNGTGQEYVIMTMGADGRAHMNCVHGSSKPAKTVHVAPVPQREER